MKKRSRLALAVLASATVLATACGDDTKDQPHTGGARGGTGGKSTGGHAGTSAGSPGGSSTAGSGLAGTAGTGGAAGTVSGGAGLAGTISGGAGTSGAPNGGMAGGGMAGGGGVSATGGNVNLGGEGGELDGGGGEAGGNEPPALVGRHHLYVGCADGAGTLQSYLVDGSTVSPITTVLAGGAISNSQLNGDGDRMYVAHTITGGETRITTYTRDTTSGALSVLGTPVNVPYTAGAGGMGGASGAGGRGGRGGRGGASGASGAGGAGGASGAANTAPGPQTLVLDAGEDYLAVPNYFAGNVYVYDVIANGSLGALVSSDAGGTNAHDVVFSNDNTFMLVPYLGSNLIKVYDFNDNTGVIGLQSQASLPEDMSGPRHIALHPNGTWLYSINETAGGATSERGSLDLFDFDPASGALSPVRTYGVPLPSGYSGLKNGAEIVIDPSGSFLYVSMRLDNVATGSVVAYRIGTNGALTLIEQYSSRGVTPRQFSLSSDGKLLVVGNQNSDNIVLFAVNTTTGKLTYVTQRDVCDSPRFARFAEIAVAP